MRPASRASRRDLPGRVRPKRYDGGPGKYLGSNYGDLSRTIILEDWGGTDDNGRDVELKHQLKNLKSLTSKPAGLMLAYVRDTDTPKKADVNRWFSVRAGTITKV